MGRPFRTFVVVSGIALCAAVMHGQPADRRAPSDQPRFKGGVELVNVTATVSDANGRYVPGLRQDDFLVYEDDQPQTITTFSAERVPVSLGIAIDTSASMAGRKISEARSALNRFLYQLLDPNDELFLYRFSDRPELVHGWTTDRQAIAAALGRVTPDGGTSLYDAVAEAIPLVNEGRHRKKALLIISDGNDTSSTIQLPVLHGLIRDSEALIYAIGIDGEAPGGSATPAPQPFPTPPQPRRIPPPDRFPIPRPAPRPGVRPIAYQLPATDWTRAWSSDRVNAQALHQLTDETGGRTEIIADTRDLDPATEAVASELSRQYYMGYIANGKKDGLWHSIRVAVRNPTYRVRARTGYIAN
jgi:Ca-activated chloride channel family protein